MNKIKEYFKKSISRKLFLYIIIGALLPLIILQILTMVIDMNYTKEYLVQYTRNEVEHALDNLDEIFTNASVLSQSIQDNTLFQERMRMSFNSLGERYSEELEANMDLANLFSNITELRGIYVLGNNGLSCKSDTTDLRYSDYSSLSWYQNTITEKKEKWYSFHRESLVLQTYNQNYLSYCRPFINQYSGKVNGVIVVEIAEETVDKILNDISDESGKLYLLDNDAAVFYSKGGQESSVDEEELIKGIEQKVQTLTEEEKQVLLTQGNVVKSVENTQFVCQYSASTGWYLVNTVPTAYVDRQLRSMISLMLIIMIFLVAVFAVISSYISKSFTRPIINIQRAMKSLEEGDTSVRVEVQGEDELSQLESGFNHMTKRIQQLINSIYEEQTKLRKSEFQALQAQINPHFLYNSLDSIIWLLRMEDSEKAIQMLENLTILFRISLSKGHEIIPVRSEIQHIRSYIAILSLRYSRRFDAEIEIEETLMDYVTPKLILQPLVENCVYHSISVEKPKVHVRITVMEDADQLLFCVEDDGKGMEEEELQRLREEIARPTGTDQLISYPKKGGYGLRNINERIKLYFGKEYGMSVDSVPGSGTAITIVIPKRTLEEQNLLMS